MIGLPRAIHNHMPLSSLALAMTSVGDCLAGQRRGMSLRQRGGHGTPCPYGKIIFTPSNREPPRPYGAPLLWRGIDAPSFGGEWTRPPLEGWTRPPREGWTALRRNSPSCGKGNFPRRSPPPFCRGGSRIRPPIMRNTIFGVLHYANECGRIRCDCVGIPPLRNATPPPTTTK
jgi:hypothetical protein